MLTDPQLYLLITLTTLAFYWLIPSLQPGWRVSLLIVASTLFIMTVAPQSLVTAAGFTLLALIWAPILARGRNRWLFWCAVLSLTAPLVLLQVLGYTDKPLYTLGLSFLALKTMSVVFDAHWKSNVPGAGNVIALNLFYPIYSAGPIERANTFRLDAFKGNLNWSDLFEGLVRILVGLFKTTYITQQLIDPYIASRWPGLGGNLSRFGALDVYAMTLLSFASLYIGFSGYSDIAIGTARLFSIRVLENFNFPFLATNIQEFWRRWHMSLGNWVVRYLYQPMIRHSGRVAVPIIITFGLVGLWHEFTINYLIWGLLHGVGLAFVQHIHRKGQLGPWYQLISKTMLYRLFGWAFTLSYVSVLSVFANAKDTETGLRIVAALFGLRW